MGKEARGKNKETVTNETAKDDKMYRKLAEITTANKSYNMTERNKSKDIGRRRNIQKVTGLSKAIETKQVNHK